MHNQALSFIGFCIIFENVGFILHAWGRRIVGMLIDTLHGIGNFHNFFTPVDQT